MARNIRLEDLLDFHRQVFTEALADTSKQRCIVCFDVHSHTTGVTMDTDDIGNKEVVAVHWDGEVTDVMRRAHADLTKRVDDGASTIALLLIAEFRNLVAVEVSSKRNGIDYFLANAGTVDTDHLIFNNTAVLEVSGLQTEQGLNTVTARILEKKKRLADNATSSTSIVVDLPTFICVVDFRKPKSRIDLV